MRTRNKVLLVAGGALALAAAAATLIVWQARRFITNDHELMGGGATPGATSRSYPGTEQEGKLGRLVQAAGWPVDAAGRDFQTLDVDTTILTLSVQGGTVLLQLVVDDDGSNFQVVGFANKRGHDHNCASPEAFTVPGLTYNEFLALVATLPPENGETASS